MLPAAAGATADGGGAREGMTVRALNIHMMSAEAAKLIKYAHCRRKLFKYTSY